VWVHAAEIHNSTGIAAADYKEITVKNISLSLFYRFWIQRVLWYENCLIY
jgi:hypothetical protein